MKYLLGAIALLISIGAGFIFYSQSRTDKDVAQEESGMSTMVESTGVEHAVVLTKDGYQPSDITIQLGDTVVFSADDSYQKLHWPASNLHPTHGIYPEFDPLTPVEPENSWSFVFGKTGEWRFHDHLAPYHTGVITVQ